MRRHHLSMFYALCASLLTWLLFFPGIYSLDSFFIVIQAISGVHSDAHSPLLSFMLLILLKMIDSLSLVNLIQIVLGYLGLRKFIIAFTKFLGFEKEMVVDRIAVFAIALLSLPITPLSIYLATVWTDTWLVIFLLWVFALLIELYQEPPETSRARFNIRIPFVVLLIALAVAVRPNTPVIFPALALCLERVLNRMQVGRAYKILALSLPIAAYIFFLVLQYDILHLKRSHTEQVSFALDLSSMIVYSPLICRDLSLESCDLVNGVFPPEFVVGRGAIDFAPNQGIMPNEPFYELLNYPRLREEWLIALKDHPILFATVKSLNFFDYILRPSPYFYQKQNTEQIEGYSLVHPFTRPINIWFSVTDWISQNPIFRWISFAHLPWLLINFIGLIICSWLRQDFRYGFLFFLLLVPFSYYVSYLLVLTASEFRFMYPSTLVVQVITLTFLFSQIARWFEKRNAGISPHPVRGNRNAGAESARRA